MPRTPRLRHQAIVSHLRRDGAQRLAKDDGVSLHQWIALAVLSDGSRQHLAIAGIAS